jgi:hypothetical protein
MEPSCEDIAVKKLVPLPPSSSPIIACVPTAITDTLAAPLCVCVWCSCLSSSTICAKQLSVCHTEYVTAAPVAASQSMRTAVEVLLKRREHERDMMVPVRSMTYVSLVRPRDMLRSWVYTPSWARRVCERGGGGLCYWNGLLIKFSALVLLLLSHLPINLLRFNLQRYFKVALPGVPQVSPLQR